LKNFGTLTLVLAGNHLTQWNYHPLIVPSVNVHGLHGTTNVAADMNN
jgi:hypothetical protein